MEQKDKVNLLNNASLYFTGPFICRFFSHRYDTICSWLNLQMQNRWYDMAGIKLHAILHCAEGQHLSTLGCSRVNYIKIYEARISRSIVN